MRHRRPLSAARSALLAARARQMRLSLTASEAKLWAALRARQLGVGFRRQAVIAEYIVDFVAPSACLVVEVDGGYHARRQGADARRDGALGRLGYRVLRLEAELVTQCLPEALARIVAALAV